MKKGEKASNLIEKTILTRSTSQFEHILGISKLETS